MAILVDGNNVPVGDIAQKIADGGGNNATLSGVDPFSELSRGIAYMLDTYAPLSKVQEVWGRPLREGITQLSTPEDKPSLRALSEDLAVQLEKDAQATMSKTGLSSHVFDTRFATSYLSEPDSRDYINQTLGVLDAVSASQQYALERYSQDAIADHKLMATGVRTFADAGIGSVNQLGTSISVSQQVRSMANQGRSYSATATRAIVQEEQAKAQGRDELLGYAASATGANISDYL